MLLQWSDSTKRKLDNTLTPAVRDKEIRIPISQLENLITSTLQEIYTESI